MKKYIVSEFEFLKKHQIKSITISTTAKNAVDFSVLPRREYENIGISSFIINDAQKVKELLIFYDGVVDYFYIDVELKQEINLYKIAQNVVRQTEIIAIKPNDTTLESLDVLIRKKFLDNLIGKKVLVIGTGNMASKIMIRLAERQAQVFVKARTNNKADQTIKSLNLLLHPNVEKIDKLENAHNIYFDVVISAISNQFTNEYLLKEFINEQTLFIDVGINNFRPNYINELLNQGNEILRLDTRIALPYQMIKQNKYTEKFFNEVVGKKEINDIVIVAGGVVGDEGSVIVDKIEEPTQIIGIADGSGGVKKDETFKEKERISAIKQYISENY